MTRRSNLIISLSRTRRAFAALLTLCVLCLAPACRLGASNEYPDDDSLSIEEIGLSAPARRGGEKAAPVVGSVSPTSNGSSFVAVGTPVASATLTSVAPNSGPVAGGTGITLAGSNFVAGATVKINGASCTGVVRVSSTQLTAVTPAGTAGAKTVTVTNPDTQTATLASGFTYMTAPVVAGRIRGTNLNGMEGLYDFDWTTGPIPNTHYAVHSNQIVDYLASKNANVIRFAFSWERMQANLNGPVPAAQTGNYKTYFDDYKRIVDYATNVKGMTVIIEPWQASTTGDAGGPAWYGYVVDGVGGVTRAHFSDFWSKMATIFKTNPRVAIGLVNEPNRMSTMTWFAAAQSAITAIRATGFTGDLHIPGNGWSRAHSWNENWYDTAATPRSNAYGWLNARGAALPLLDPLNKLVVGVHTYADPAAGGGTADVVSGTISRQRVAITVDWARANGLKVFLGEIGMYANATHAVANWNDFITYSNANTDTLIGWAWWACGKPGWWDDVAANGGGHFSITPTSNYTVDTVNMNMIEGSFSP